MVSSKPMVQIVKIVRWDCKDVALVTDSYTIHNVLKPLPDAQFGTRGANLKHPVRGGGRVPPELFIAIDRALIALRPAPRLASR